MDNRIKFQFDDKLAHQIQAIDSTVELFNGLPKQVQGLYAGKSLLAGEQSRNPHITMGSRLLENLRKIQLGNRIFSDDKIYDLNFGIEMETGTGKTYVYLRTILSLYKTYGFKKFMIIVPSIAIRKGVEKSIDMLKDHLKALYNLDITKHSFVYDSSSTQMKGFIESSGLSICVMNMQAFAADRTKVKNADESGHIIWEELKELNPIVLLDEPQRIEGTKKKPSKSIEAVNELNPLFILKYSATHKKEFPFNMIYKLDSFDAFQQDLVKKICVKTVYGVIPKSFPYIRYIEMTRDLKAKLEIFSQEQGGKIRLRKVDVLGGASLLELSGGLSQYSDMRIAENPHKLKPLKIATISGHFELEQGQSNKDVTQEDAVRIQIELAIENHLQKQFEILDKGYKIKALTLFFIDSVSKVRDDAADDGRGEYLRIFDETYKKLIESDKYRAKFEQYNSISGEEKLFAEYKNVSLVREGYFARDKHNKIQEVEFKKSPKPDDEYVKKSQEDIDRGIELILEKKDELISFNTPLAFVFSHSALREGWDNPNIFTLCTLKSSVSDIAKKQEIGRGLRLPVDVTGKRIRDNKINELTVIANEHYDVFAETLQKDFNDSMAFNRDEVTAEILTESLKKAGLPEEKITPELVDSFKRELQANNIINNKNVLSKDAVKIGAIEFKDETLKEHAAKIKESFTNFMHQKGSHKIPIINKDEQAVENKEWNYVSEESFKKILDNLRNKLMKRSIYRFNLEQGKFIDECAAEINEDLKYKSDTLTYEIAQGSQSVDETRKFDFKMSSVIQRDEKKSLASQAVERSYLEAVDSIMYHTMLPRLAVMKIINGLEKPYMLKSQDILEHIIKKVSRLLKDRKAENINAYEVIEGYELDSTKIFEADIVDEELLRIEGRYYKTSSSKKKAIHEYYKMDSRGEYSFAQQLENNDNIFLFTKLKKGGFVIDTPYGNYSPDWAIIYQVPTEQQYIGKNLKLYFITETKADKEKSDLTGVEINKINCGKLHFKAVSDDIKFDWVNSYSDFKNKFGVL